MKTAGIKVNRALVGSLLLVAFLFWHFSTQSAAHVGQISAQIDPGMPQESVLEHQRPPQHAKELAEKTVDTPFMPKMANETLKAELGNAAWKLLHTILARYPDQPTQEQKNHLSAYVSSFAQVYPCGDCARHFIKLLAKYPPQVNSRKNAAIWGCFIHNRVNERLGKDMYDCTTILEDYDCGCGADEESPDATLGGNTIKDETSKHLQEIRVESSELDVGG